MKETSTDWKDITAEKILHADINMSGLSVGDHTYKDSIAYQTDPITAIQSAQKAECANERIRFISGAAIVFGLLTFIIEMIILPQSTSEVPVAGWMMIGVSGFALVCGFLAGLETANSNPALRLLDDQQWRYLPHVVYEDAADALVVSLTDDKRTYHQRSFLPYQQTEALEYQVELESIIHDTKEERIKAFLLAYSAAYNASAPALPPSSTPAALLEQSPEVSELRKLLESQQETISATQPTH